MIDLKFVLYLILFPFLSYNRIAKKNFLSNQSPDKFQSVTILFPNKSIFYMFSFLFFPQHPPTSYFPSLCCPVKWLNSLLTVHNFRISQRPVGIYLLYMTVSYALKTLQISVQMYFLYNYVSKRCYQKVVLFTYLQSHDK